jgi:alpha-ketoglutarate-dependent taurine dioxygenase
MIRSQLHFSGGVKITGSGDIAAFDQSMLRTLFREEGVVLLSGFDVDLAGFDSFSARFAPDLVGHPNVGRKVQKDRTLTNASPGNDHFFAHAELGYTPFQPDIAWFYCQVPARKGGETVVYDGVEILARLTPKARDLFRRRRILFELKLDPEAWHALAPDSAALARRLEAFVGDTFRYTMDGADNLMLHYLTSAIVRTRNGAEAFCNSLLDSNIPVFEDRTPVPKEALFDIIGTSEDLARPVQWKVGDILLVDNRRFMHGRRAFDGHERVIVVRFANLAA